MKTSNLTPTKLIIGCVVVITIGVALFRGFTQVANSASTESTPAKPLVQEPMSQADKQTSYPSTMSGFETIAEKKGKEKFIEFADPHLQEGRGIWLETCENCHAWGTAGAPIPMEPDAWKDRVIKEKTTLYDHAINGFFGPDDTMMPARGGNEALSDEHVKAAVDYMVALASYYINGEETPKH